VCRGLCFIVKCLGVALSTRCCGVGCYVSMIFLLVGWNGAVQDVYLVNFLPGGWLRLSCFKASCFLLVAPGVVLGVLLF